MTFNDYILERYLRVAPMALAIERSQECRLLANQVFERPILDVGCGDGIFAKVLFKEPIDTGIDVDAGELAKAEVSGAYSELIDCPAHRVPKEDGAYRTIMSNSVLEHVADLRPVLAEIHRLLAPEGQFYVTLPTVEFERCSAFSRLLEGLRLGGLARSYRLFYNRFWRHHNVHDEMGWRRVFQDAGFRVLETHLYGPRVLCTVCDLLVPIAIPAYASKLVFGRWIAVPRLRACYANRLAGLAEGVIERSKGMPGVGLIFLRLTPA